jgi:guanylate kinase
MEIEMGKIFYLMGKSSSGKDSIFKMLTSNEQLQLHRIIPYTTRPMREGEEDGREYFFADAKKLEQLQKDGKVIELRTYHTVYGDWNYFTVDDGQFDLEKNEYLVIGTLESYLDMCHYYGKKRVIPIYVEVEDGIRLQRALDREKKEENPRYAEMCRRFLADAGDFSEEKLQEAEITKRFQNVDLQKTVAEITTFISAESDRL